MGSCPSSASLSHAGIYSPTFSPFSRQLERSFKFVREAEDQLKAIPQFCFPDAKDWTPVEQFTRYVPAPPLRAHRDRGEDQRRGRRWQAP